MLAISTDHTRAMISFNSHTQPKKWALLDNPTSLVRKPEVREVGWVAWGHVAGKQFLDPLPSALSTQECLEEPGTHWRRKMKDRETVQGLEGQSWNNIGASCPLSSLSAGHVLNDH